MLWTALRGLLSDIMSSEFSMIVLFCDDIMCVFVGDLIKLNTLFTVVGNEILVLRLLLTMFIQYV